MKLIDNPKTNGLIESFQANDIKFAFATETSTGEFQLIHTWVKCREYFNELLMKNYHSKQFSFEEVHGFQYDYEKFPMDLSRTMFAMKFPTEKALKTFQENIGLIHKIEDINNIDERTVISTTSTHPNTVLVQASKFWIQKALLLNIYTLILKLMSIEIDNKSISELYKSYVKTGKNIPSEVAYINALGTTKLNKILNNLPKIAEMKTIFVDGSSDLRVPYTIHGHSGILACFKPASVPMKEFFNSINNIANTNDSFVEILV